MLLRACLTIVSACALHCNTYCIPIMSAHWVTVFRIPLNQLPVTSLYNIPYRRALGLVALFSLKADCACEQRYLAYNAWQNCEQKTILVTRKASKIRMRMFLGFGLGLWLWLWIASGFGLYTRYPIVARALGLAASIGRVRALAKVSCIQGLG